MKPVALALIFTFSYSQLVWAIDVRQMLLDAKASFEEDEIRRSSISPARLEETQAAQQAEIDQQQALQELMSFRLTTQNGDILNYVGQTLKEVERPDGTRLKNITLDSQGRITGADLSLADGSVQLLDNGKVIGYRLPNGTSVEYDAASGKISKVISPEGVLSNYSYAPDGQGGELITVTTGSKQAVYGSDGRIRLLTDTSTGTVTDFVEGRISKVTLGGVEYRYVSETLTDGTVRVSAAGSLDPDAAYKFAGGRASVESSGYNAIASTATHTWTHGTVGTWYSGDGYLTAGPDLGNTYDTNISSVSPRVDYKVRFDTAGTYYLWVRGYATGGANDSVHAGLDGAPQSTSTKISGFTYNTAKWANKNASNAVVRLVVSTPGEHTVNFWMREDGFKLDKFLLTTDAAYVPTGLGETESARLSILDVSSDFPSEVLYAADGSVLETHLADGSRLVFDGGLLKEAYDAQGERTAFAFAQSSVYNITQSRITTDALDVTYTGEGVIGSLKVDGLTIHYKDGGAAIHYLEKEDGTEIYDPVFDAQGNLTGGEIVLPDGSVRLYEDGLLKIAREPDQTKVYYEDLKPVTLITPEKLTYHLDHTLADRIEATLDEDIVPSVDTIVRYEYDTQMNLRKAVRHNQEIISYLDERVVRVEAPDSSPRVFAYQHDTGGALVSYTITQGNVVTHYDAQDRPMTSIIRPDAEHPDELEVLYQYGKIRQIKKNGVVTFNYAYRFEGGEEVTEISDVEEDTLKTYKAERLLGSLDRKTTVLSSYAYGADGQVSRVDVTRYGRTLHTYDYSYEGELTHVVDEKGVRRTYDAERKLQRLAREGVVYGYTYHAGDEGQEIVQEELLERQLSDGSRARYTAGAVTRVDRADGSVLTDIELDEDRRFVKGRLTLADGTQRVYSRDTLLEEILPDGTHFYLEGERIRRVTAPDGTDLTYTYTHKSTEATAVYDRSLSAREVSWYGDAATDPTVTKYGGSSMKLDGAHDYLMLEDSDDWTLGTGDFTIELWARWDQAPQPRQHLLAQYGASNRYWALLMGNGGAVQLQKEDANGYVNKEWAWQPVVGSWHHLAVVRQGNTLRFLVDGIQIGQTDVTGYNLGNIDGRLYVGQKGNGTEFFKGRLEEIRISKTARYTGSLTAPKARFLADADTKLLLGSGDGQEAVRHVDVASQGLTYRYKEDGSFLGIVSDGELFTETAQRTFFEDLSSKKRRYALHGDAHLHSSGSKWGVGAIRLDGSGDSISLDDSADWTMGTGDFTVDLWALWTAAPSGRQQIVSHWADANNHWQFFYGNGGVLQFIKKDANGTYTKEVSWAPTLNTWHHLALVRSGSTLSFMVDGAVRASFDCTGLNLADLSGLLHIGQSGAGTEWFKGRLEDVRVSRAALWTGAFTPPSSSTTATASTALLLSRYTVSVPAQAKLYKAAGGSYFGLTSAGAVSVSSLSAERTAVIAAQGAKVYAGSALPYLSKMKFERSLGEGVVGHYRFGELAEVYENGVLSLEYSRWNIGGRRETFVEKKGLLHRYGDDGAALGFWIDNYYYSEVDELRVFADHSASRHRYTLHGNTAVDRTVSKFGASLAFDGAGDSLSLEDSPSWTFGTGDWTIDFWARFNNASTPQALLSQYVSGAYPVWDLRYGNGGVLELISRQNWGNPYTYWTVPVNQWTHIAVQRSGSQVEFYVNGTRIGSGSVAGLNMADVAGKLYIGQFGNNTGYFNGRLEDIRIRSGAAYSGSYTVPTEAAAPTAGTRLLLHEHALEYTGTAYQSENGYVVLDAEGDVSDYALTELGAQAVSFIGQTHAMDQELPYRPMLSGARAVHADFDAWVTSADLSVLDPDEKVLQEYDSEGVLETLTRADGTVTLFEADKPSKVLGADGVLLMEYLYDAEGHLTRIVLKDARERLSHDTIEARRKIETDKAAALLALAQQKNLAVASVRDQVAAQRAQLQDQMNQLQAQYDQVAGMSVKGKAAKSQRGDALNQIGTAMDQVRIALGQLGRSEADTYAALDADVAALGVSIESDALTAYTALSAQEAELERSIIRQEISPVIYDHYRRILGRDPSSAEYEAWISKAYYEDERIPVGERDIETVLPGRSVLLDGQGDHLLVADNSAWAFGTSDFTVDLWVRFDSVSGYDTIWSQGSNSTNYGSFDREGSSWRFKFGQNNALQLNLTAADNLQAGQWYHVALVRSGNTWSIYRDGQLKGSTTSSVSYIDYSGPLAVGTLYYGTTDHGTIDPGWYLSGRVEEFRISHSARWTGAYTPPASLSTTDAHTKLLIRASSGAGAAVQDVSDLGNGVTLAGDARADLAQWRHNRRETRTETVYKYVRAATRVKIGESTQESVTPGTSLRMDGVGDYLLTADNSAWAFGTSDFTVDLWVRFDSVSGYDTIWSQGSNSTNYGSFDREGSSWRFKFGQNNALQLNLTAADNLQAGQWYHVALVRSGNTWSIYRDGQLKGSTTSAVSYIDYSGPLAVGTLYYGTTDHGTIDPGWYLRGSVQDFRISSGARWTAAHSKPTYAAEPDDRTRLLLRTGADPQMPAIDAGPTARLIEHRGGVYADATLKAVDRRVVTVTPVLRALNLELTDHISSLPELAERQAYVGSIKERVRTRLTQYVAATEAERLVTAQSLGLGSDELIPLTASDAAAILEWLDDQSLHFGQSAFLSLEALLDQQGISYAREDIAERSILIDILTGVITPLDRDGDLLLSVYSLRKVGTLYGLATQAYNIDWADLVAVYQADPSARIVAHINGVHYIVITGIDAATGKITYIDMGAGKDKQNEVVTADKSDWLKAWKGDVLTVATLGAHIPDSASKVLTQERTRQIRGAFFGFLIPIVAGFFAGVGGAIATIAANIGALLSTVGSMIAGAFSSIGSALSGIGSFLSQGLGAIFQGIHWAVASLVTGIGQLVGGVLGGQMFASLSGAAFGGSVFKTAVAVGLNFAVSKGLDALGVSPVITGLLSAFTTGGFLSTLSAQAFSMGAFVAGGLKGLALESVQTLSVSAGLDSSLASALSLAAGQFTGGILSGNVGGGVVQIAKNLATNLAFYGVQKLGAMAGLDPRVSGLIGAPVSGALGVGLQGGENVGTNIVNAINDGLLRGVTNIAINYAGEAFHLNPLLTSLSAMALGGAISGLFGLQQVDPSDPNHLIKPANMFEGISNAFMRGLSSALTFGAGNDSWSQAAQLQRITSFSTMVQQLGLSNAIDNYATSIFQQSAIEQMVIISGSVKQYIEDQLRAGNYVEKTEDGYTYKYVEIPGSENDDPYSNALDTAYIKIDTTAGHEGVYGVSENGYVVDGEYDVMSDGGLGLKSGSVETIYQGSRYIQKWYNGRVKYTNIIGSDGYMGTFYNDWDGPSISFADQSQFFDGRFVDLSGSTVVIQDSNIIDFQRSITMEGIGQFTSDVVTGLDYANNIIQDMQLSASRGALTQLMNDEYKNIGTGMSAASLANFVGDNARQYLRTYYDVQDTDFARFAHLFGEVGDKVASLYSGFLDVQEMVGTAIVDGLADAAYLGTEFQSIWDESGEAYQLFKAGDLNGASELMGSVGTRLYREGNRILTIATLGMTAAGKSLGNEAVEEIAQKVVRPLSRQTDFYVRTNGDIIPANGYRYISKDASYLDDLLRDGKIPANESGTYISFNKYRSPQEARDFLQLPEINDASIRIEFDTLQVADNMTVPYGKFGKGSSLEPLAKTFPELGPGGGTQTIVKNEIRVKRIVDIRTGKILKEFE